MVDKLIAAGMDVARLNFSHGTYDTHRQIYETLRERAKAWKRPLTILQDLQGPKIRLGIMKPGRPLVIADNSTIILSLDPNDPRENSFPSDYKALTTDVVAGDPILLDDGNIALDVLQVTPRDVTCRVVQGGVLRSKVGMHLPKSKVSSPAMSEKDVKDLHFGLELGVDYIALSFVRNAQDVLNLKHEMRGKTNPPHIIAKIERPEAVTNLEEIVDIADGLMVARGDLGVELPPEKVPVIQKYMIDLANGRAKPVIVATQMLESMITSMRPTRAEASDVANAIFDGADAVMLSAESASGAHPVRAVEMMARLIREVEASPRYWEQRKRIHHGEHNLANAITQAAVAAQEELDLPAIVSHTMSGYTARLISSYRPQARIVALSPVAETRHRANLYWGVTPAACRECETTEELIDEVERVVVEQGHAAVGETIAVCANIPFVHTAAQNAAGKNKPSTNFLKLHALSPPVSSQSVSSQSVVSSVVQPSTPSSAGVSGERT